MDKAESQPEICAAVNGMGTVNIVRAALSVGAKFVFISTDYVFPGTGDQPWQVNDPYGPLNVYGMSKVQGEDAVRSLLTRYFILRTSWVYGKNGHNFVRTMLRLGAEKKEIRVVNDQIGSPTYTRDLARVICDMLPTEKYGIYHVRNEGFISWYQFAKMIMEKAGLPCKVLPIPRPRNGRSIPAWTAPGLPRQALSPCPPLKTPLTAICGKSRMKPVSVNRRLSW